MFRSASQEKIAPRKRFLNHEIAEKPNKIKFDYSNYKNNKSPNFNTFDNTSRKRNLDMSMNKFNDSSMNYL